MENPDPEGRIQPPESQISASLPVADPLQSSGINLVPEPGRSSPRALFAATLFGAMAGLLMGSMVGAACLTIVGSFDFMLRGALMGGLIGTLVGGVIGFAERKIRGAFIRPDIATIICVVFGLLPALLILVGGFGGVDSRFSMLFLLGAVSTGPMVGLLIGGALDGAYEASLAKSWRRATTSGFIAMAICVGIVYGFLAISASPVPEEIKKNAKSLILKEWRKDEALRSASIDKITLVQKTHTHYSGSMEATIEGETRRFALNVEIDGLFMKWELKLIDE